MAATGKNQGRKKAMFQSTGRCKRRPFPWRAWWRIEKAVHSEEDVDPNRVTDVMWVIRAVQ